MRYAWPATRWTSAAAACSRPSTDTAAAGDPLSTARRTLHTGADLHTDRQRERIRALFVADEHVELEATWGIYQRMIAAFVDSVPRAVCLVDELAHMAPLVDDIEVAGATDGAGVVDVMRELIEHLRAQAAAMVELVDRLERLTPPL